MGILLFEETPVIDSKKGFIQIARKQVMEWGCEQPIFQRIKMSTKGAIEKALLAAILSINIVIDRLDELLNDYEQDERELLTRYLGQNDNLFKEEYTVIEAYPKKMVLLETRIAKELIEKLQQLETSVLQQVKSFIDRYVLIEEELFAGLAVPFKHE